MKIIYNCYGAAHSSVTSAAIHIGILPNDRVASKAELLSIPYYDAQVAPDHGRIRFMGYDKAGHEVYIASKHNLGSYYNDIMLKLLSLSGYDKGEVVFVDTMPYVNLWMMIGGYISRRLGLRIGRTIILYGTQRSYYRFADLVCSVKRQCQKREASY